jgi:two-component system uhpT operon response regulator UhpA
MMSMHEGMTYVHAALRRGALGYVTKAAAPDELARGIRAVAAGQSFLSSDLALEVPGPNHAGLTPREIEVLVLLAKGRQPKQVAAELGISTKTAYVHRSHLLEKLGLRSDLELYRFALAAGLLSLEALPD